MKTRASLDPAAAFPDPKQKPTDVDLKAVLGAAFAPLDRVLADLQDACPRATSDWQYSNQAGWYRVALLKKRRLFYLVPQRGAFRLSLLLGAKAIASLQEGPHAAATAKLLKTAKRYPEGTAFSFDPPSCDPALIGALLAAKLAH